MWVIGWINSFNIGKYALSEIFFIIKTILNLVIYESKTLTFHNELTFLNENKYQFKQKKNLFFNNNLPNLKLAK